MGAVDHRPERLSAAPLTVGQVITQRRSFSQADFDRFASLSRDDNPIHVDPAFASRTRFGRTVAHGMLLYSAVEAALSRGMPGLASISQTLKFPSPTYAAEEVCIRLEVTALDAASGSATVATTVIRPDGAAALEGEAVLRPPDGLSIAGSGKSDEAAAKPATVAQSHGLGHWAELRRSFSLAELAEYGSVASGRPAAEAGTMPSTVPGGLLGSLFSCLLGTRLPGQGANYLKQRLTFDRPAHPMQELTARVEVIRVRPDKQLVNLNTLCTSPASEVVCSGEALVLVSDVTPSVKAKYFAIPQSLAAGDSRPNPSLTEEN